MEKSNQFNKAAANNASDRGELQELRQNTESANIINNVYEDAKCLCNKAYCGHRLGDIIEVMIEANGLATEGGEALKTAKILAEQFRVPMSFDADKLYELISTYVTVENKDMLAEICKSAVRTSNLKYGHKALDNAIHVLEKEGKNLCKAIIPYSLNPNEIPIPRVLPRIVKVIMECFPREFHHAVLAEVMACLSFYAEGVTAIYNGTEKYRLLWLNVVLAEAAGGKSFLDPIKNLFMQEIIERDMKFYAEEETAKNSAASGKKGRGRKKKGEEAPADAADAEKEKEAKKPKPIQYVGSTTSITELMYRTLNSMNHNLFMYNCEGAEFFLSCRRGPNTDIWSFLRKAVEGSEYVQSHHSVDTVSGICYPHMTAILCVQPNVAIPEFENHLTDGTASRAYLTTIDQKPGSKRPRIKPFSDKLRAEVADAIAYMKTLNEEIELPRLHKAIDRWLDEKAMEYEQTDNLAIDHFRRRAAQMGYKAGVFFYLLNGRKEGKHVIDYALYVAEYVLRQQVFYFGEAYNKQNATGVVENITCNVNYYNMLPEEFTASQFSALRTKHGEAPNVRTIISRWRQKQLIEDVEKGKYRKVIN